MREHVKKMKQYLILISILFLLGGCLGQNEETVSGEVIFPNTDLAITVPQDWLKTKIPGNQYPILFTKVDYGIKPNIQLEFYSTGVDLEEASEAYLNKKKKMYPDHAVIKESIFFTHSNKLQGAKLTSKRKNNDNTPIIHLSYIFSMADRVFILSATCAEPSLEKHEKIFDEAIRSIQLLN